MGIVRSATVLPLLCVVVGVGPACFSDPSMLAEGGDEHGSEAGATGADAVTSAAGPQGSDG
ncbi:MAG: hypothetical protein AAF721_23225, partial [Myxococcota bacterium]